MQYLNSYTVHSTKFNMFVQRGLIALACQQASAPAFGSDILQVFEEKSKYNRSAVSWMVANPGKRSVYEIAAVFGRACMQTATPDKAINCFEVTGIWPHIQDFAAAYIIEKDMPRHPYNCRPLIS